MGARLVKGCLPAVLSLRTKPQTILLTFNTTREMEVTLIPGIAAVSGTLCKTKNARVIFTTRKASSTNPNKVRMYIRSAESYKRTTPPSENESRARGLFARRQSYVQQLLASGAYHSKAEAWKIAKRDIL